MPSIRYPLTRADALGFQAPKAIIPLPVYSGPDVTTLPFLFDTGAAVSLIAAPAARALGILTPAGRADLLDEGDAPVTLRGRLTGTYGEFRTRMLGQDFAVPCFFYEPRDRPPGRYPADVDEWAAVAAGDAWAAATPAALRRAPCVLGRLGFLSRFAVTVDGRDRSAQVVVSDDPGRPAPAGPERF